MDSISALETFAQLLAKDASSAPVNTPLHFPMYVVPVEVLLKMTSLKVFEELVVDGSLVKFDECEGHALFVSHQWLGVGHPDPDMEQFSVLQEALQNVLTGASSVSENIAVELWVGRGRSYAQEELTSKPLFIWYDYFCCPQSLHGSASDRDKAILSIPAYVERCRYFAILCPPVRNGRKETMSKFTWASRAWCRLERVCKELSLQEGACDAIEIQGARHLALAPTFDWVKAPVGEGAFTDEEDRAKIAPVLQAMVRSKMIVHLREGRYHEYRLIFNLQRVHFTDMPVRLVEDLIPGFRSEATDPAEFFLEEYMYQNGFTSPRERDSEGWTPLCYATLLGNPLLIFMLLEQKADPNDAITQPEKLCHFAGNTCGLHMCAFLKHNEALRLLLFHEADVNARNAVGATALHWAAVNNNVEGIQILRAAGLGIGIPDLLGYVPFDMACAAGNVEALKEFLPHIPLSAMPAALHAAVFHGGASTEVVKELLQARCDMNDQQQVPLLSPLGVYFGAMSLRHSWWSHSPLSTYAYHHRGATPLMGSILTNSFEASSALIAAGARQDLVNHRGKSVHDLARDLSVPDYILGALRED